MLRKIGERKHKNKKGIWKIVIEYQDKPDNAVTAHWIFYSVTGPQGEEFIYRVSYTNKVMKSPKYLLNSEEKRIEDGFRRACMWIEKERYQDKKWIVDTQGSRRDVS